MTFLSLIVVLAFVQWWGSGGPLQRDGWFLRWLDLLQSWPLLARWRSVHLAVALAVPCLLLAALVLLLCRGEGNWLFFVYVPVLLYSLGRGDFSALIKAYLEAGERGDSVAAARQVDELTAEVPAVDTPATDDWQAMHGEALHAIAYRGFERLFAVLFWFFVLGAPGALLYRLSVLYRQWAESAERGATISGAWLHLLEWPAVRVTALTWALVGNFDGCVRQCRRCLLQWRVPSATALNNCLRGALGAYDPDEEEVPVIEPAYSRKLVAGSQRLLSRALLLWVCALALVTLLR